MVHMCLRQIREQWNEVMVTAPVDRYMLYYEDIWQQETEQENQQRNNNYGRDGI